MKKWFSLLLVLMLATSPLCALASSAPEEAVATEEDVKAYASMLDMFYYAAKDQWPMDKLLSCALDSEDFPADLASAGYVMRDLDKDGAFELVLLKCFETPRTPVIAVYTMKNGMPSRLLSSFTKAQFYLLEDGRVYCVNTKNDANTQYHVYALQEGKLVFQEGVYTAEYEQDGETVLGYFAAREDKHQYAVLMENLVSPEFAAEFCEGFESLRVLEFEDAVTMEGFYD